MAQIDPAMIGIFIPIIALMIPIVAILVRHQQRMAEIIHSSHAASGPMLAEVEALRREVTELKQLLHQQTISVDNLLSAHQKKSIAAQAHSTEPTGDG